MNNRPSCQYLREPWQVLSCPFLLLIFCESASAQGIAGGSASAGTLVAASLESVGYIAQSQVLKDLSEMLETGAALVYLGVIVSVIITYALQGNYRTAGWVLVGPSLFALVSGVSVNGYQNRIEGAGVEWQFSSFRDSEGRREKILDEPELDRAGEVSYVFHKYNALISEGMQLLISKLIGEEAEDLKTMMGFMARQRTMDDLFRSEVSDSGLGALATYFAVHCHRELSYARDIGRGNRDQEGFGRQPEYPNARYQYCRLFPMENKALAPGPWKDFMYSLGYTDSNGISSNENREDGQSSWSRVSCSTMWQYLQQGARHEIQQSKENAAAGNMDPASWRLFGTQLWQEILASIEKKISDGEKAKDHQKGPGDPCPQVLGGQAPEAGQDGTEENLNQLDVLTDVLSGYLIRKALTANPSAAMLAAIGRSQAGVHADATDVGAVRSNPVGKDAELRRIKMQEYATSQKWEAFSLVMMLPYLQGLLLLTLATTYPFFALTLLMPGQAGSFFNWMMLWAWVKSWDVGWALVMIADEVLWNLMPHTAYINLDNPQSLNSPVSLLETAFHGDPAYGVSMYWILVGMMISGVPLVTAQAFLGAKKAIAGIMIGGIADIGQRYGASAADWFATENVGKATAGREYSKFMQIGNAGAADSQEQNRVREGIGTSARSSNAVVGNGSESVERTKNSLNRAKNQAVKAWNSATGSSQNADSAAPPTSDKGDSSDRSKRGSLPRHEGTHRHP